jgi:hypothetical protein
VNLYQLTATGLDECGLAFRAHSKQVYSSQQAADDAIPQFIATCTDIHQFFVADADTLRVSVVVLDFIDK